MVDNLLRFYAGAGLLTDPREYGFMFDGLPSELAELCGVVQNALVHIFWAERMGLKLSEERKSEVNIRSVRRKLEALRKLDDAALTVPRLLSTGIL